MVILGHKIDHWLGTPSGDVSFHLHSEYLFLSDTGSSEQPCGPSVVEYHLPMILKSISLINKNLLYLKVTRYIFDNESCRLCIFVQNIIIIQITSNVYFAIRTYYLLEVTFFSFSFLFYLFVFLFTFVS